MGFFGKSDDEKFRESIAKAKKASQADENLTYEAKMAKYEAGKKPVKKVTKPKKGLMGDKFSQAMGKKKQLSASEKMLAQYESGSMVPNDVSHMLSNAYDMITK